MQIKIPNLGDIDEVEVIEICVAVGDSVGANDTLIVIESDKASMDVPAEVAGTVTALHVALGDMVAEGSLIADVDAAEGESATPTPAVEPDPPAAAEAADEPVAVQTPAAPPSPAPVPAAPATVADATADPVNDPVYAGPATRRLARELGVDLTQVSGTGQRGRIVKDDVKAYVKSLMNQGGPVAAGAGLPQVASVDFARFGPVETVALSRIRQRGVTNLHASWVNVPHVTQHDEADITDLEAFRSGLKGEAEKRGVRLTPLAFIVKACARVLKEQPEFNSSLHSDGKQLIMKGYINIGMAVDTPEGLVVPVIRGADQLDVWELSAKIADLANRARDKKLAMDDLQGGTFSVSSLGALGGTGFTPIVNSPEVAILGVAKLQTKPVWDGDAFVPRKVLPLALSYDHRVINGADGGRFMVRLTELLNDIRHLAL